MNQTHITIIVPAYNSQATIKKCLDSLLSLDYSSFEIIIVDDGSTDRTREILSDLRATFGIRKSQEPLKNIQTSGEFKRYLPLLRKPVAGSRYKLLGEEVFIQKSTKVGPYGGRLSFRGEKSEILSAKRRKTGGLFFK